ncbi:MAG: peptidase S41, partial [Anaerolineae bacterium]|nr:peptidase S41 [Anaerolineae bacterium]
VLIEGTLNYTNLNFTLGVSEPVILLETEANFVDRNEHGPIPIESQVIGQITSDFFAPPVSYTLALPEVPNGPYRDVDNNDETNQGIQVYGVAYWENVWGDPYLEERDLYGYGYSTAYASMRTSPDPSEQGEVIGGKYVVYAPDDQQGFPSGFGEDGKLFTEDDPVVTLPAGYTVVDMDTDPFTFDRSRVAQIDLIEGEASELDDYSQMGYAEAFKGLVDQMRNEYAYTEYKNIDWDALEAEFMPRFEQAEKDQDVHAYLLAVRDFQFSIPDGHVGSSVVNMLSDDFVNETAGGLGMAIMELDDGRVMVYYILPDGPADEAGIEVGAEISEFNGEPVQDAINGVIPWSGPFSSPHVLKLQQLRYVLRSEVGTEVPVTFQNPDASEAETATLTSIEERQSFSVSSFAVGGPNTGFELPVEYELMDNGYVKASIFSFSDNSRLSIELWERMIQTLNDQQIPGLIIDMRHNDGGSGWLADQMAAYFYDDPLVLGNSEFFDKSKGEFYLDPEGESRYYPPPEQLRYHGSVAVLVGPACSSACEFFSYDMTLQDRAAIVGQYPSGGLGGGIEAVLLPEYVYFQFPFARNLDADGNIVIEGTGVVPTVKVPVDEETVFAEGDPVLDAAVNWLDQQ